MIIKILFYLILLFILTLKIESGVIENPWLQAMDRNSVTVMVESDDSSSVVISYKEKTAKNYLKANTSKYLMTDEGGNTYIHRVVLENLKENTEYIYSLEGKDYTYWHRKKRDNHFLFANMGDNRSGPKIWADIALQIHKRKPDFSIYNGDLAYDSKYQTWLDDFFIPEAQILNAEIPFFNAIGNHEGWKNNTKAFLEAPKSKSKSQAYYSFDYQNAHFLILNTEVGVKKGSPQWKFAEKDLKESNKKWKFVVFHIPAYSSGGQGENENMKNMCSGIFEKYGVDIVLTGHTHFYEHNFVNGIHHFVIAGGGSPLYTPKGKEYTVKSEKKFHFAMFEVNENIIKIEVIGREGEIIDTVSIIKE